jgi:hypothetical protein
MGNGKTLSVTVCLLPAVVETFACRGRRKDVFPYTRIIHEDFCCNRQLHAISSCARSLRFGVLQVRLQGNSLRLA